MCHNCSMGVFDIVLNIVFPALCFSCGSPGSYICTQCAPILCTRDISICPVCTKPAIDGVTHPKCRNRYALDGLTSIYVYRNAIQHAIKHIKYRRVRAAVPRLMDLFCEHIASDRILAKRIDSMAVMVPIPLHWRRQRDRTFNQVALCASHCAQYFDLSLRDDILVRTVHRDPQVRFHKRERVKNAKGIFAVSRKNKEYMTGKNIILFDDVWTTGATMREAGNVLKRAGAKSVWAMTIAR